MIIDQNTHKKSLISTTKHDIKYLITLKNLNIKMYNLIHPYFFLINNEAQSELLTNLDEDSKIKIITLGLNLLDLDESILEGIESVEEIHELLYYISQSCSSDNSLSKKIIESIISRKKTTKNGEDHNKYKNYSKVVEHPKNTKTSKLDNLKITPNKEQEDIVNNCHQGIQVDAFAGSGKSTVSRLIIDELGSENSIYTAFLKENINDAKKKITENSYTQDALAVKFALEKSPFKSIFSPRENPNVYKMRDTIGFDMKLDIGATKINQQRIAKLINDTISLYCYSCDDVLSHQHVPPQVLQPQAREKIVMWARTYWDYLLSGRANSEHKVTFHHLMKFWSISPSITIHDNYTNLIVDEAQDLNGAFFNVIKNHNDRRLIVIGDAYQQLFKWRGAINSMGLFDKEKYSLTTSYRFGPAIADISNKILSRHSLPPNKTLIGQTQIQSKVIFYDDNSILPNKPGAILTRTRCNIISIAENELKLGNKIHIKTEMGQLKFIASNIVYLANNDVDKVTHPYLSKISNFSFLESELQDTPEPDVYFALKLYEKYKGDIINVINRIEKNSCSELEATKIISTTHSIKGNEWDSVVIASDYSYIIDKDNVDLDGELSVLYVAITRAKKEVYIPYSLSKYFEHVNKYV